MLSGTCPEKRTIEGTSFKLWIFTNLWMRNSKTQPSSLQYQYFLLQVCSIFDNFVKLCNFRQAKKIESNANKTKKLVFPKGLLVDLSNLLALNLFQSFLFSLSRKMYICESRQTSWFGLSWKGQFGFSSWFSWLIYI